MVENCTAALKIKITRRQEGQDRRVTMWEKPAVHYIL